LFSDCYFGRLGLKTHLLTPVSRLFWKKPNFKEELLTIVKVRTREVLRGAKENFECSIRKSVKDALSKVSLHSLYVFLHNVIEFLYTHVLKP